MFLDIIDEDAMRGHTHNFVLWPKLWKEYPNTEVFSWEMHKLNATERPKIPEKSGIYTLIICPEIAGHPACHYLIYVGQAVSLHKRFGEYLTKEKNKETGRPKVYSYLNRYEEHLWFCFTPVDKARLTDIETLIYDAFGIPPANGKRPRAASRKPIKAF